MNPLDWTGPNFLVFFVVTFLLAMLLTWVLGWLLRTPADEPPDSALDLSPYEAAYLAGGNEMLTSATIARMIQDGIVTADSTKWRFKTQGSLPPDAPEIDRTIYAVIDSESKDGCKPSNIFPHVISAAAPIRRNLEELGLLLTSDQLLRIRLISILPMVALLLLGVMKIVVGITRDRPVQLLVALLFFATVVTFFVFLRSMLRSRRGDRALALIRKRHAALETQSARRISEMAGHDLMFAVGLFGLTYLSGTHMTDLRSMLSAAESSPSSSSCSTTSCGSGGGCSSGCGGCSA